MDPIYKTFFTNVTRMSGKVFDSPDSQLFRLERATDKLLPLLHPSSRPVFARSAAGIGLQAHTLQLNEEGSSTRSSLLSRGLGLNRKLGRKMKETSEKSLKFHLNRLNTIINQFKE